MRAKIGSDSEFYDDALRLCKRVPVSTVPVLRRFSVRRANRLFIVVDAEGKAVSSDFYLRLAAALSISELNRADGCLGSGGES